MGTDTGVTVESLGALLLGMVRNAGGEVRIPYTDVFTNLDNEQEILELAIEDDGNTVALYLVMIQEDEDGYTRFNEGVI